jgi:site-specific DNA-methyltransferase (adenine-specific)
MSNRKKKVETTTDPAIVGNTLLGAVPSVVYNEDCVKALKRFKDNHFDLAIVDPPYGIGFGEFNRTNKASNGERYKANKYKNSNWDDDIPSDEYFAELMRVSKNQIVWGGNYFPYLWKNGCKGFIYWHKGNPVPNFADGELAWTSFNKVAKQFDFRYYGNLQGKTNAEDKIHPTQKPVALYDWLLQNYAETGMNILDTHLGSGSSRIAAYKGGFNFVGFEIDPEYYEAQEKRFKDFVSQLRMF